MLTKWSKAGCAVIAAFLLLTGCGTQQDANETSQGRLNGLRTYGTTNDSKVSIFRTDSPQGGISSHIESQLSLYGVQGAKVLVIGDMVLVGFKNNSGSNQRQHSGSSQNGLAQSNYWDLTNTKTMIQSQLGVPAKVYTVSDPSALDAMIRIQQNLNNHSSMNIKSVATDLQLVLKNAIPTEGKQTQGVRQGQK